MSAGEFTGCFALLWRGALLVTDLEKLATLAALTAFYRVLVLFAASLSILRADLTLKVRTNAGAGRANETTEYYKGDLMRRDYGTGYRVVDFANGRNFSVDPEKKEYYPSTGVKMKQVLDPAHKIFIETTCAVTGEQRQCFGYTARHYLTTKKSHDELNGRSSEVRETLLDAWVLDLPVPPHVEGIANPNGYVVLSGGGAFIRLPDVKATHSGARPHGLVVQLKTEQYDSEVVALSLAPLDESLFAVPKSFRENPGPRRGGPASFLE